MKKKDDWYCDKCKKEKGSLNKLKKEWICDECLPPDGVPSLNNMYNQVLDKLSHSYKYRERRMKNAMIAEMLFEKWRLDTRRLTTDMLEILIVEAASLDRYWRLCLRDNPALRGADYNDKRVLSERKQLDLGYEPHYRENQKALKKELGTEALAKSARDNHQKI